MAPQLKVLVTGATGYVGKRLCTALIEKGHKVRAVYRARPERLPTELNLSPIPLLELNESTDWSRALDGIDCVIHLAAIVHQQKGSHEKDYFRVNTDGTIHLARSAESAGVKRFIFMSTIGVHGRAQFDDQFSVTENSPIETDSPYTKSKWLAEQSLRKLEKIQTVILRPPMIYGPNAPGNPNKLVRAIEKKIPLPLSSIDNKKSFIHIDRLIEVILTCLIHPDAANETFVVADTEVLSTPGLIKRLAQIHKLRAILFPFPAIFLRILGRLLGQKEMIQQLIGSMVVSTKKFNRINSGS